MTVKELKEKLERFDDNLIVMACTDINGIDRIDSTKGYIKDNVVSCCEMCNRMKLNYDAFQWIEKIKKIAYRAQKGLIYEPKD